MHSCIINYTQKEEKNNNHTHRNWRLIHNTTLYIVRYIYIVCAVMSSDPPSTRWSQCSKYQLLKSFDEDLDYCLHNVPQTIYDNAGVWQWYYRFGRRLRLWQRTDLGQITFVYFIMIVVVVIVITVVKSSIHLAKIHL